MFHITKSVNVIWIRLKNITVSIKIYILIINSEIARNLKVKSTKEAKMYFEEITKCLILEDEIKGASLFHVTKDSAASLFDVSKDHFYCFFQW